MGDVTYPKWSQIFPLRREESDEALGKLGQFRGRQDDPVARRRDLRDDPLRRLRVPVGRVGGRSPQLPPDATSGGRHGVLLLGHHRPEVQLTQQGNNSRP